MGPPLRSRPYDLACRHSQQPRGAYSARAPAACRKIWV